MTGPFGGEEAGWRTFEGGFRDNHGSFGGTPKYPDGYWNPTDLKWYTYSRTKYSLVDPRVAGVDVNLVIDVHDVFRRVTNSWESIRAQHPSAIWDPRNGEWRIPNQLPPVPVPERDDDTRLRAALAECNRRRDAGLFNSAEEYEECRQEAFRLYPPKPNP